MNKYKRKFVCLFVFKEKVILAIIYKHSPQLPKPREAEW